jgi:uncharacterized protein (UPF0332 family)
MVKYLDSFKDCFEKGLLRNTKKQPDLAVKDLKVAEFYLKEAEDQIDLNKDIMAALALYNAYFHCVRSLLFNDGVKERSHFCIARYLEKYVNESKIEVKFLNAFETVMSIRHNAQYSTEKIEIEEDLTELYNMCAELIKHIAVFIK